MEVSPQDEVANPKGMEVFAVERHGLLEGFATFRTLCGMQSSHVFSPNRAFVCGEKPGETLCFGSALS